MAKSTQTVKLPRISFDAVYNTIGAKGKTIPPELSGTFLNVRLAEHYTLRPIEEIPPVTLKVYRSGERTRLHRLFVVCPECAKELPFANLPSHYTTKQCREGKRHETAKITLPEGTERAGIWSAGKYAGGYMVALVNPYGFHATAYKLDGSVIGRVTAAFADNASFTMFYLNPSAFSDWFAEQEELPAMGFLRPNRFAFWKAAFVGYAVSLRTIDYDTAVSLSGNAFSRTKRPLVENETAEAKRERIRLERKDREIAKRGHLAFIKSKFEWLTEA